MKLGTHELRPSEEQVETVSTHPHIFMSGRPVGRTACGAVRPGGRIGQRRRARRHKGILVRDANVARWPPGTPAVTSRAALSGRRSTHGQGRVDAFPDWGSPVRRFLTPCEEPASVGHLQNPRPWKWRR